MGTWARTLRILVVVLALVAMAAGAAPASASQGGGTQCVGPLVTKVMVGDLMVPPGRECFMDGTVVLGNLRFDGGAGLSGDRAEIAGDVQVGQLANVAGR